MASEVNAGRKISPLTFVNQGDVLDNIVIGRLVEYGSNNVCSIK